MMETRPRMWVSSTEEGKKIRGKFFEIPMQSTKMG
jgi:hypothetical protein